MNQALGRRYDSYAAFYRDAYAPFLVDQRAAGRIGTSLLLVQQPAGAFPDAPHPDLCLQFLVSDSVGAGIDTGAGRFQGTMPSGSYALAPPNLATDYVVEGPHRVLSVAMPYAKLAGMAQGIRLPADGDFGRLHKGPNVDPLLHQIALRLWEEAADGSPQGALFADGAALAILSSLLRQAGLALARPRGGLPGWRLRRVTEYMEAHLSRDVSLAELAAEVGLSPYHFARAFREATGHSPHAFLVARRVERAKQLLSATPLPLAEIALACGFSSQTHLGAAFKKATGQTPGRYRAEAGG